MDTRVDSFLQTIETAKRVAKQDWLNGLSMADWWKEIKKEIVGPIFDDAIEALKRASYSADKLNKNRKGILLQAGNPCLNLEFTLDDDVIKVTSSASSIQPSAWDERNDFTEDVVVDLVNQLLELVARQGVTRSAAPALSRASE